MFIKSILKSKTTLIILSAFTVISVVATLSSFLIKPQKQDVSAPSIHAMEEIGINYTASVFPCTQYPNGSILDNPSYSFLATLKAFQLQIHGNMSSDQPVQIKGSASLKYIISAQDMWNKEYTLEDTIPLDSSGTDHNLFDKQYNIDIKGIRSFISKVSTELDLDLSDYNIRFILDVKGNCAYQGREYPIDTVQFLDLEISDKYIKRSIPQDSSDDKTPSGPVVYREELPIDTTVNAQAAAQKAPVQPISLILLLITVVFLVLSFILYQNISRTSRQSFTEAEIIERKYGKRIIKQQVEIRNINKPMIYFPNFHDLIRIVDERDLLLLRCAQDEQGPVDFYALDQDYIYVYQTKNDRADQGA